MSDIEIKSFTPVTGNPAADTSPAAGMNIIDKEIGNPLAAPVVLAAPATGVIDTKTTRTRSDKTIQIQIHTNAMKYLTELANKAFEDGRDEGKEYVPPTEAEIRAECKKRWQKHLDLHAEKKDVSIYFS